MLSSRCSAFALAMFQAGCNLHLSGTIGAKLVHHHNTRRAPTFQKLEQKPLGGNFVSPRLDNNVEDAAVRITRTPQPMCLAFDPDDNLIEIPFVG